MKRILKGGLQVVFFISVLLLLYLLSVYTSSSQQKTWIIALLVLLASTLLINHLLGYKAGEIFERPIIEIIVYSVLLLAVYVLFSKNEDHAPIAFTLATILIIGIIQSIYKMRRMKIAKQ